jgi:hypothetical protein
MDFEIALVPGDFHGLTMEWRSAEFGLLTPLMWPIHLEDPDQRHGPEGALLRDGWQPVGTPDSVYTEVDQGFLFASWADDRFVYVEYGADEEGQTYSTWYRVLRPAFDQAWDDMLRRLDALPRPAAGGDLPVKAAPR